MKKLTMFGIITCVVLLLAPVAGMSASAGPPSGLEVTIVNPLPVPVTDAASCTREPVHFVDHVYNLESSEFTILSAVPANKYLVIETVSVHITLPLDDILNVVNLYTYEGPHIFEVMWIPINPNIEQWGPSTDKHYVATVSAKGIVSAGLPLLMYLYINRVDPEDPDVYYSVTGYYVDMSCPSP